MNLLTERMQKLFKIFHINTCCISLSGNSAGPISGNSAGPFSGNSAGPFSGWCLLKGGNCSQKKRFMVTLCQ